MGAKKDNFHSVNAWRLFTEVRSLVSHRFRLKEAVLVYITVREI